MQVILINIIHNICEIKIFNCFSTTVCVSVKMYRRVYISTEMVHSGAPICTWYLQFLSLQLDDTLSVT